MRKSDSDSQILGRGSSSGSNSTVSVLSRNDTSDHEILIDKEELKQVRLVNLKDRDLSEAEEEVDAGKQEQSIKSLHISGEKELDGRDQSSPRSKEVPRELKEDRKNGNMVKRHSLNGGSRDANSTPPPLSKGGSASPVDPHEPEPHHPRYLNQAYWESSSAASQHRNLPQEMQRRLSSPFLQTPSGLKLSAQNRFKLQLNNPSRHPQRRSAVGKEGTTAQRVASAKRMTISDLKSKIKMLQDEIEKLRKENRFLNHLQHRQDNALKKWEGKDADLPRLLNQHKDEIRALQQQLRKQTQLHRECNDKLTMRDKKIFRLESELDKLRTLANEEHLQDRHQLQEDLDITRMNLTGAEKRIKEYMKHVDILEKNHRHQLSTQDRKLIKVNNNTYELQQVVANLRLALRNKDRMLNYIQMRSSGRNLIRSFHAEKVGIDDMLYGTSIAATDISRPYQQLEHSQLLKIQKPESIFGNKSECVGYKEPSYGNGGPMQELDAASQFSNTKQSIDTNIERCCNEVIDCKILQKPSEVDDPSIRPLSKHSRSLDSMIRVATLSPRSVQERKIQGNPAATNFPRGPPPIKQGVQRREMKPNVPIQIQQSPITKNPKVDGIVMKNQPQELPNNEDVAFISSKSHIPQRQRQEPPSKVGHQPAQDTRSVDHGEEDEYNSRTAPLNIKYNQTVKGHPKNVKRSKSREFVYHASVSGFKYEGPFMKNSETLMKQQSTEILYNAKAEKLSRQSVMSSSASTTSSYTSQSASSTRSEMLSNIDILSARIRESCVLVPPPEEKLSSSRSLKDKRSVRQDSQSVTSNVYFEAEVSKKSQVGPSGDGLATNQIFIHQGSRSPTLSLSPRDNFQNLESSYYQSQPAGVLQLIATEGGQALSARPNQTFLCTSPREQMQAILQVNDSSGNTQIISPRSQSSYMVQSRPQLQDSNMVLYSSPRMSSQNNPSFNNVNFLTESQANYPEGQQSQPSLPTRFPYFPYASPAQDVQSANVSILQPNHMYDQHHHPNSTHSFPQQNTFFSQAPSASAPNPNTLPTVGFFNSVSNSGGGDSTLPSINNNSSATQPSYNPNYYVNLSSWK